MSEANDNRRAEERVAADLLDRIIQAIGQLQELHKATISVLRLELANERARRLKAEARVLQLTGAVVLAEFIGRINEWRRQQGLDPIDPLPDIDLTTSPVLQEVQNNEADDPREAARRRELQ